jgi:bile acid:Na+ symporter, BASS family
MEEGIVTTTLLPLALATIMFGMGLTLSFKDFKRAASNRLALGTGVFMQVLVFPFLGISLAEHFHLRPALAVGLVILAVSPTGPSANLMMRQARGNISLSKCITAISSVLAVFSLPFYINFALRHYVPHAPVMDLKVPEAIMQMSIIALVPFFTGAILEHKKPLLAQAIYPFIKKLSIVCIVASVLVVLYMERVETIQFMQEVGPAVVFFNVAMLAVGYVGAKLLKQDASTATTLAIDNGMQNVTMAIVVATTLLHHPIVAIAPAVYAVAMFTTGWFIVLVRKKLRQEKIKAFQGS